MAVDVALLPAHPVLLLSYYSIHAMATGAELVFPPRHMTCVVLYSTILRLVF